MKFLEKNKIPINIAVRVEDNDILDILMVALEALPEFSVSLDCIETSQFWAIKKDVEILMICEEVVKKTRLYPHDIKKRNENNFQILVVLSQEQETDYTNYLDFADGCIFYDENLDILPAILRSSKEGYHVFPDKIQNLLTDIETEMDIVAKLSLFECALLHELSRSSNESAIARHLSITGGEIRTELQKLYNKLDLSLSTDVKGFTRRHMKSLYLRRRELVFREATKSARRGTGPDRKRW